VYVEKILARLAGKIKTIRDVVARQADAVSAALA
jgi:hypothetical protein